jgi:hypothetical protein
VAQLSLGVPDQRTNPVAGRTPLQRTLRKIAPVWVLCLVIGSMLPGETKLRLHTTGKQQMHHQTKEVTRGHHLYHYGSFGLTAVLFLAIAESRREEWRAIARVILIGLGIEITQHLVYLSVFEWWDVRDDGVAALAVFALWHLRRASPNTRGGTAEDRLPPL